MATPASFPAPHGCAYAVPLSHIYAPQLHPYHCGNGMPTFQSGAYPYGHAVIPASHKTVPGGPVAREVGTLNEYAMSNNITSHKQPSAIEERGQHITGNSEHGKRYISHMPTDASGNVHKEGNSDKLMADNLSSLSHSVNDLIETLKRKHDNSSDNSDMDSNKYKRKQSKTQSTNGSDASCKEHDGNRENREGSRSTGEDIIGEPAYLKEIIDTAVANAFKQNVAKNITVNTQDIATEKQQVEITAENEMIKGTNIKGDKCKDTMSTCESKNVPSNGSKSAESEKTDSKDDIFLKAGMVLKANDTKRSTGLSTLEEWKQKQDIALMKELKT